VLAIHEELLVAHGGAAGIRDRGLLESALARPQHIAAYADPDIFDLAAAYASGIVRNHPFIDGNKRTGFMAAYTFLGLNRQQLVASEAEATAAVLELAAGTLPEAGFAAWLRDSCEPVER
jgi:death-on-curing protein